VALVEIFKKNNFSINFGGNYNVGLSTVGYELEKWPLEVHFGVSKTWQGFFDFKKGWGIFAGVAFSF